MTFHALFGALAAAVLGLVLAIASDAKAGPLGFPPACNVNPCVIKEDNGGYIRQFEELADRIKATRWIIKVDGECYSACTLLMDRARPYVCITSNARLFIHKGSKPPMDPWPGDPNPQPVRFDVEYSDDLDAWISDNGGQPGKGGWLYMDYLEAKNFWPNCQGFAPLKKLVSD
jgi:hypothetical protein